MAAFPQSGDSGTAAAKPILLQCLPTAAPFLLSSFPAGLMLDHVTINNEGYRTRTEGSHPSSKTGEAALYRWPLLAMTATTFAANFFPF